ncbi:MAG TPA: hypothetical protein VGM50_05340 [Gemmatimonadaceae bacterium]
MRFRILGSTAAAAFAALCFALPVHAQTTTAGATVCADGTTVPGTGRDICAHHGGLKAAARTTTHSRVTCADSTVTAAGADACKDHGGVRTTTHVTRTTTVSKSNPRPFDHDSTHAIALCKDGLFSHARSRRSACTDHGGVDRYLRR